jgi:hypothetical protein
MVEMKRWLAAGLLLVALGSGAAAAAAGWQALGSRVVADRLDHDSIAVTGARGDLRSLKLVVERAPVHFLSVQIHFANGETQDVELRAVIPAGGESRVIDLVGAERVVRRVEFWYEAQTARRHKAALIRLFGRG